MLIRPEPQIALGPNPADGDDHWAPGLPDPGKKSSIAPLAARMPKLEHLPLRRPGPAEQAALASQSLLPMTISALVPDVPKNRGELIRARVNP